ncbi:MAG: hypothetical protein AAGE85_12800 [Pseudomonadota bacterium]
MLLQRFFIALAATASMANAAEPDDVSAKSPERAQSLTDALQVSHRLISRVADNFSCNAEYDVATETVDDRETYVARIYGDTPGCREMLVGLNTWGELYGVRFELRKTVYKRTPVSSNRENDGPPQNYRPTLIHEVNPDAASGQGD